ncbi:MFS transporter [Rickettsiales bacterium]|nr:MFS transporter [Rickettsiales bacterium]
MASAINKRELYSYGILATPLAFAGIPLYIHAPDFYATEYGVSLASLGVILLSLRFLDAIQDPIIGYLSDKYSKYRPKFMLISLILMAISFTLLFKPLTGNYLLWFAVFVLLATTAFSILTINLNTLGGLWSKDKNQKTTIAGYRETFGLIGLVLAVTLPSIFQNHLPKEQAFSYVSFFLFVIIAFAAFIFSKWQKGHLRINERKSNQDLSFKKIKNVSGDTKKFFVIYGISILASSIPAVLVLFFIRDRLDLENYAGLFLLAYFLSGAIGITIWNYVSRQIGKHKSWGFAMLLAIASFIWAYFLSEGDFWPYLAICIISGIAFGAELVLPSSILADHIHKSKNEEIAAIYFGFLAFLAKLALALASALTLPYLQSQGFVAQNNNSQGALHALSISYAAIPCFIKLISIYLLWRIINEKNINLINRSSNHA